jgi:hypothetical protein
VTAEYYRAWRAAHPDYRKRQRELRADRRRRQGREDRTAEYAARAARRAAAAPSEMPVPHTGHELFDLARAVVGPNRSGLTVWLDPLHQDLLSVATLALLEGADPAAAVKAYRSREYAWRRVTGPLVIEEVHAA